MTSDLRPLCRRREFLIGLVRHLLLLALALLTGYLVGRRSLGCRQTSGVPCQECVLLWHCRGPVKQAAAPAETER